MNAILRYTVLGFCSLNLHHTAHIDALLNFIKMLKFFLKFFGKIFWKFFSKIFFWTPNEDFWPLKKLRYVKLTKYHWCWKRGSVGSSCGGRSTKFSTFKGLYPRFSSLKNDTNIFRIRKGLCNAILSFRKNFPDESFKKHPEKWGKEKLSKGITHCTKCVLQTNVPRIKMELTLLSHGLYQINQFRSFP